MNLEIHDFSNDADLIAQTAQCGRPRLKVVAFDHCEVVLGRGSKPDMELIVENCEADGVRVSRRPGGGCAVVLDPGNVIVSLTLPVEGIGDNSKHFCRITKWIIAGLNEIGIPGVRHDGISDFVLRNKKVGGSSIYRGQGVFYYSTTLLVDPRLELVTRYLKHPPKEPAYRKGRPHANFMGTLKTAIPDLDAVQFAKKLTNVLKTRRLLEMPLECPKKAGS